MSNRILGCVSGGVASRSGVVTYHLLNHTRSTMFSLGSKSSGGPRRWLRTEARDL